MKKRRKKLIQNSIIIPLIVAFVVGAISILIISEFKEFPFRDKPVIFSSYEAEAVKDVPEYTGSSRAITRDSLPQLEGSTIVGSISYSDVDYPLIYSATDANAIGKVNITNGKLVGELGCSYMELYKKDASKLHLIGDKDAINIETFYSSYEIKIVKTERVSSYSELMSVGDGVERGIVLYTDASSGIGISNEYFACVGQIVSGEEIE